jgi:hypothetical protein
MEDKKAKGQFYTVLSSYILKDLSRILVHNKFFSSLVRVIYEVLAGRAKT